MYTKKSYYLIFLILVVMLLVCFLMNLCLGSESISIGRVFDSLLQFNSTQTSWEVIVINKYRLPKAIVAIITGSGLGISGLMMQTLFRNPLAGPFVLGVTSGASLGVATIIMGSSIFGGVIAASLNSSWTLVIAASLGSFFVLLTILLTSNKIKDTMTILIIGLMFGSISSAAVHVLSYFSSAEQLQQFTFWGFGSLGNLSWNEIIVLLTIYSVGLLLSVFSIKALNALLLGEGYAKSLGVKIKTTRIIIIIATSFLAGTITAFVGPIAFIGLAIPHITRQVFNTSNHKILIPAVFLLGSIVMLICDSVSQLPTSQKTLPINAITSLIGSPVVIWLLVRKRKIIF